MSSTTTTVITTSESPFTSGAMRSGRSVAFWKAYVEGRPSPTENFFELMLEYHKSKKNARTDLVHDVGTGPGNIAFRLAVYFDRVVGSDLNGDALAVAQVVAPPKIKDRLSVIQSRAEDLLEKTPIEAGGQGNTDLVVVSECMPLLDAPKALKAWHGLLRPGGTVAIYFYGPPVFTDGDADECNAAYDALATRICTFNQPMKGTPGYPMHYRAARSLLSYLDDVAIPTEDWEQVERHKWNCDYPLLFNSKAGFDFDFEPLDATTPSEKKRESIDRDFWSAEWSIDNVTAYLDSVYPNYRDKAGDRYSEVKELLHKLSAVMGHQKRHVTFSVVLILATKKGSSNSEQTASVPGRGQFVRLSANNAFRGQVEGVPQGNIEKANELLQKNHDNLHVFWRDINGHNHMAHYLLTIFALGGTAADLQRAYDDSIDVQRSRPAIDPKVVEGLEDDKNMLAIRADPTQYTNVLTFFEQQLEKYAWQDVVHKYCFSGSKLADTILACMFDGAHHPFIHLGLGVEFQQPSIIAEALAQAVTHSDSGIPACLLRTEEINARDAPFVARTLSDLYAEAQANEVIRNAAHWDDLTLKMAKGVLGRGKDEITNLAAQYRIKASELDLEAAATINWSAYIAGAAQRPDKMPRIDFFSMHNVTSSIFLTVLLQQDFISLENKVRLVQWKARTDLLWYAACGCASHDAEEISQYRAVQSAGWDWPELYAAIRVTHDDGHLAKFVRALKSAYDACKPYEWHARQDQFPVKGDAWINLARMAYDSTFGRPDDVKWLPASGFPQAWGQTSGRV